MQNIRFEVPSKHSQWHAMQQGETNIAAWLFHKLSYMYKNDWVSFDEHIWAPCVPHLDLISQYNSQISCQMSDLRYHLRMRKWNSVSQGETFIAAWVFQTFLICIKWLRELWTAYTSPLWSTWCYFFRIYIFENSCKISELRYPLSTVEWMVCYNERHSLLFDCFIALIRCISIIRIVFGRM